MSFVEQTRRRQQAIDEAFRSSDHQFGVEMTTERFLVLQSIDRIGPSALADVARDINTHKPAMTRNSTALECAGLLRKRKPNFDARVTLMELTAKGRDALDAFRAVERQIASDLLGVSA